VPEIDIRSAAEANLAGASDPEVLRIAAEGGRLLISQDRGTMPGHLRRFVAGARSPGLILVRERTSIATAIEDLVLIWSASEPEEWTNRLLWIPL
jgi:hypothetical protein